MFVLDSKLTAHCDCCQQQMIVAVGNARKILVDSLCVLNVILLLLAISYGIPRAVHIMYISKKKVSDADVNKNSIGPSLNCSFHRVHNAKESEPKWLVQLSKSVYVFCSNDSVL